MPRKTRKRSIVWRGESRDIENLIDRIDAERGQLFIGSAQARRAQEIEHEQESIRQRRTKNRDLWALYWHSIADNLLSLSGMARQRAFRYEDMEIVMPPKKKCK